MDGRGECCIARYARGAYDMSKMDRIMLRYRPIAPKPTARRTTVDNLELFVRGGKRKRRYGKRRNKLSGGSVVTLPLLPESPDDKLSGQHENSKENSSEGSLAHRSLDHQPDTTSRNSRILASCVTVECVTDTWTDGDGLGCTDEEKIMSLEKDSCPGFISDGWSRISWTNGAFRKMVGDEEMVVWLVMKERVRVDGNLTAFTCRVRMELVCGNERSSLTLPCDVWRMDGGGFAWRLDVTAALSLGRW